jgi:hypothetical protein
MYFMQHYVPVHTWGQPSVQIPPPIPQEEQELADRALPLAWSNLVHMRLTVHSLL